MSHNQKTRIYALINRHIEVAVSQEWPEMAHQQATLSPLPTALIEALHDALTLKPADDSQRTAQPEMIKALHTALDASTDSAMPVAKSINVIAHARRLSL